LGDNYSIHVIGKQIMSQIILQKKIFFELFNYSNVSLIMELIPPFSFKEKGLLTL